MWALMVTLLASPTAQKFNFFDAHQSFLRRAVLICHAMKQKIFPLLFVLSGIVSVEIAGQTKPNALSTGNDLASEAGLRSGQVVYEQHCAACHGVNGDGNGPAMVWLFPKPRNFNTGLFKIQSTPSGSVPTDDDLFNTVTRGMPGSSMPSFSFLSESQRREVVQYVKYLTAYLEAGRRVNRFEQAQASNQLGTPIAVPPEPPATFEAMTQGKALFTKLQCHTCHGETGAGDGPSAAALKDNWGFPLVPRDFNSGAFRGGATGTDLFLRIATGLAGTPMPPFGEGVISDQERWSVVHYIQSLRRKEAEINDILAPSDAVIHVQRVPLVPADPADPAWERLDPARIPLNPLFPEPEAVPAVAVRALYDTKKIAVLLQWRDAMANGAPVRVQDFQDAAALQFSMNGNTPFLGMGDAKNPVNLWIWKAGLQQEMASQRPDVNTVYASMHSDVYFENRPLYRTAEAAGNFLARSTHSSPIEDANASGFGTLKSQPFSNQNVQGKGLWFDGHWTVLFVRELQSDDADDVLFSLSRPGRVAFAVWDGEHRDRNGRKVISSWYQLVLEP